MSFQRKAFAIDDALHKCQLIPHICRPVNTVENASFSDEQPSSSKLDALPFHTHKNAVEKVILVRSVAVVPIGIRSDVARSITRDGTVGCCSSVSGDADRSIWKCSRNFARLKMESCMHNEEKQRCRCLHCTHQGKLNDQIGYNISIYTCRSVITSCTFFLPA